MSYGWHDLLGNLGVMMILVTYLLLQIGRILPGLLFSVANGVGALLILVSLLQEFNLSAFLMEAVWFLISLYGVARYFLQPKTLPLKPPPDRHR